MGSSAVPGSVTCLPAAATAAREIREAEELAGAPIDLHSWESVRPACCCCCRASVTAAALPAVLCRRRAICDADICGKPAAPCPNLPVLLLCCAVIWASWLNRGTNFAQEEREQLRIEGLLPPVFESMDLQVSGWAKLRVGLCWREDALAL